MIFDFKSGEEIELIVDPNKAAEIETPGACCHFCPLTINEAARTCTCSQCGQSIDVFTAVVRLMRHYETRIDSRLIAIKEFDARERAKRERRDKKRKHPNEALIKRRAESLERAAYNEYQAKLLTIRASKQRATAEKCDQALAATNE